MSVKFFNDNLYELKNLHRYSLEDVYDIFYDTFEKIQTIQNSDVFGSNENYVTSDMKGYDRTGFWNGFPPKYVLLSHRTDSFSSKPDIFSMDMTNFYDKYGDFIYFEFPHEIARRQIKTHDNEDLSLIYEFHNKIKDIDDIDECYKILEEYDKKYDELYVIELPEENVEKIKWRVDFNLLEYFSYKRYGIFNPILYNDLHILARGSHRSFYMNLFEYNVPMFVPVPIDSYEFNLTVQDFFSIKNISINVNLKTNKIKYLTNDTVFYEQICD